MQRISIDELREKADEYVMIKSLEVEISEEQEDVMIAAYMRGYSDAEEKLLPLIPSKE